MVDDPNSQPLTQAAHPRPVEEVKEVKSRKTILDIFKSIFKKK